MGSTSDFFTHATNFSSGSAGGVDPRTGTFNVRLALGNLVGNRNLGPSFPLDLSYSPLTWTNMGLGQGVSLGLTTYDTKSGVLSLSAGGQYVVDEVGDSVVLQQNTLDAVHVTKEKSAYRVVHKSGSVELLTGPDNADPLKVPTDLLTPAGHRLTLSWDFTQQPPRLKEVRDAYGPLLTVEYDDTSAKATVHVLPESGEAHVVELSLDNGLLGTVRHGPKGFKESLVWEFQQKSMGDDGFWGNWITGVTMKDGASGTVLMSESAEYRQDGHAFPDGGPSQKLPYVTAFTQVPGGDQLKIEASYSYSAENFVGGLSHTSDWKSKQDNLYDLVTDYGYTSTEKRICGKRTTEIERAYNQFHLQKSERTTAWTGEQEACVRLVETQYYAVPGKALKDQLKQFQLPYQRKVTWTDAQGQSRTQPEITTTEFDTSGNPTKQTDPDGRVTIWEYYDAKGDKSKGAADDPNGFTRLVKSMTRKPSTLGVDGALKAPEYTTTYQYGAYPTADTDVKTVVLKTGEQESADGKVLQQKGFTYSTATDAQHKGEFGRLVRCVETEHGDDAKQYATTHSFTFEVKEWGTAKAKALVQTHELRTHDALAVTRTEKRSPFTGRLWSTTDAQGNTTDASYDWLGRLLTRVDNPGTPYEAQATHAYTVDGGKKRLVHTSTDVRGNQLRESFDGAGRSLQQDRLDLDGDKKWYPVRTVSYDEQGEVSTVTVGDRAGSSTYETVRTFTYDDWGQVLTAASSTGATHLTRSDPVHQTTTTQLTGDKGTVSGTEVTTHDLRGSVVRVERYAKGDPKKPVATRLLERDGWGRLRRDTDERGHKTLYEYDARGRLVRTTLPDGTTQITRDHAPFSPDDLITGLTVKTQGKETPYGTQSYDGLGRLRAATSGGRSWSYTYDKAECPLPSVAKAPDHDVHYTYVKELGNALAQLTAGDVTQKFSYDERSGLLTTAEQGSSATVKRTYHASGRLQDDITEVAGHSNGTASTTYTLNGSELSYHGVDGAAEEIARDRHGRIAEIKDPAAVVSARYDDADRVSGWTTTDKAKNTLTTELKRDDFGREVERTISDGHGATWTLTQGWLPNDLLGKRTLKSGTSTLRDEAFTYDERNRLTEYACTGSARPRDEHDDEVTRQTFAYDGFGNVTTCTTTFPSGSDTATYAYENKDDPCQLTGVTHTQPTSQTKLTYDAAGRLTVDAAGRKLVYDALGRLASVSSGNTVLGGYAYDPLDRLLTQQANGTTSVLSYRREELAAVTEGKQQTRFLRSGEGCMAQIRSGDQTETRLLGTDGKRTVLVSSAGQQHDEYGYTAYGYRKANAKGSVLGHDGQRIDPALGWFHLGNGYRAYDPVLMRFTTPDSLSPFGAGGINPYAYCLGDPVNRNDPSGHLSWGAWASIAIGIGSIAFAVVSGGASMAMAGVVGAALSASEATTLAVGTSGIIASNATEWAMFSVGIASSVTGIASGALEKAAPKASSILGWVSFGTGVPGLVSMGKAGMAVLAGTTSYRVAGVVAGSADDAAGVGKHLARGLGHGKPKKVGITSSRWYRDRKFEYVHNRFGQRVHLTEYEAVGAQLDEMVDDALTHGEKVAILSGTHGSASGNRTSRHIEPAFFQEDQRLLQQGVKVYNLPDLTENKLSRILNREHTSVIAAFCFSRNDYRLRKILELQPSVSYVGS
ncbi:RHS repeat-associated core domain-containing protein [Streptomyces sp. NPDC048057]|uniref:RHS repeat-associated core domain-containing protein n=1 Tax=Streptomyces sp. NPDC048057 TaxID=3155628 RepID=UPI0034032CD4